MHPPLLYSSLKHRALPNINNLSIKSIWPSPFTADTFSYLGEEQINKHNAPKTVCQPSTYFINWPPPQCRNNEAWGLWLPCPIDRQTAQSCRTTTIQINSWCALKLFKGAKSSKTARVVEVAVWWITLAWTLSPTAIPHPLSSRSVREIILRQIANRGWMDTICNGAHPNCVSGDGNLQSCHLRLRLSSLIADWHLPGCWCRRMTVALSSGVPARGCVRPRSRDRSHPGRRIEVTWLNLQIGMKGWPSAAPKQTFLERSRHAIAQFANSCWELQTHSQCIQM